MLISKLDKQFKKAKPILKDIANIAKESPQKGEDGAAHIVNLGSSVQYCYYTLLVDSFLKGEKGKVVDWGGQYGHVTSLLRTEGYDAENYLLSPPPNFEKFQKKLKFPFKIGSPLERTKLPYEDNSVLAVCSSGVLEHVRERGTTEISSLSEIFRIVKPGGYLFIWNLPHIRGFPEIIKGFIGKWHHPYIYTKKCIVQLLESSGFEVIFCDSHEFLPIGARKLLTTIGVPPWLTFEFDYFLSKIPPFSFFRQHITVVCRKDLVK